MSRRERTKSRNGICPTGSAGSQHKDRRRGRATDLEAYDAGGLLGAARAADPGADQPDLAVPLRRSGARVGPNLGVGQDAVAEREPALPPPAAVVGPLVQHPLDRHLRARGRGGGGGGGVRRQRQRRRGVPRQWRGRGEAAQRAVVVLVVDSVPAAAHALRHPATGARQRRRRGDGGEGRGAAARGRRERREFRSPRLASPRFIFSSGWSLFKCGAHSPPPRCFFLSWLQTDRALFGIFLGFFSLVLLFWPELWLQNCNNNHIGPL